MGCSIAAGWLLDQYTADRLKRADITGRGEEYPIIADRHWTDRRLYHPAKVKSLHLNQRIRIRPRHEGSTIEGRGQISVVSPSYSSFSFSPKPSGHSATAP